MHFQQTTIKTHRKNTTNNPYKDIQIDIIRCISASYRALYKVFCITIIIITRMMI